MRKVPSGLRAPPLLPLFLTDLSAVRARALAGLPVPCLLDKGWLLALEFCVSYWLCSFIILNSPLGEQLRRGRPWDKGANSLPNSKARRRLKREAPLFLPTVPLYNRSSPLGRWAKNKNDLFTLGIKSGRAGGIYFPWAKNLPELFSHAGRERLLGGSKGSTGFFAPCWLSLSSSDSTQD